MGGTAETQVEQKVSSETALFPQIIGGSRSIQKARMVLARLANVRTTVLLRGERGTGKGLFAAALHSGGARQALPFVTMNCNALPETLIESEVFGHERGAFTGAVDRRMGKLELANGGTIFLDEIGDMPVASQVKLLQVIEEQEFCRIGGTRPIHTDARIVAATNRDLEAMVAERKFREDLYDRLNVIPLFLPPLRNRREDIPLLVESLLQRLCLEAGVEPVHILPGAMTALAQYGWPGNVRELQNVLARTLSLHESDQIGPNDWIFDARLVLEGKPERGGGETAPIAADILREAFRVAGTPTLKEVEAAYFRYILSTTKGNRTQAARILGVALRTVRNRTGR